MGTQNSAIAELTAPTSTPLTALAEQLRDGPLQDLIQLQLRTTELADRLAANSGDRLEDLERLVRLSLQAMERFHAFTREFAAVLRELTHDHRDPH